MNNTKTTDLPFHFHDLNSPLLWEETTVQLSLFKVKAKTGSSFSFSLVEDWLQNGKTLPFFTSKTFIFPSHRHINSEPSFVH